jgi:hypothetical protein
VSGRPRQWIDGVAARPDSELQAITAKHVLCIVVDRASIGSDQAGVDLCLVHADKALACLSM